MRKHNGYYTHRGVSIYAAGSNSSGIRWWALIDGAGFLRADTIEGMRRLINETLEK